MRLARIGIYLSAAVLIAGCLFIGYAYFIEPSELIAAKTDIIIDKWNEAHDGLKIIAIGDIHGGSNNVTTDKLKQVVALTNEQNADLIVLLGDYVSQRTSGHDQLRMPMSEVADGLSGLKAKYGVFAVLGNHDGWYNDEIVSGELNRVGYRVLDGECARLDINGVPLRLLGLKDQMKIKGWKDFSDNAKDLLKACGEDGDVVVLEHSPDVLPIVAGSFPVSPDLRLFLAAHTHGGQVWLPILGRPVIPSSYGQTYAYGHIKQFGVDMFVTSGIGTSILPIRFMVPPEIAVLTIRSGN